MFKTTLDAFELFAIHHSQCRGYFLQFLVLLLEALECHHVSLVLFEGSDYLLLSLLNTSLDLGLKVVLGESPANIRIVLKAMESPRVH